jgi:hypothetical protein
MISCRLQGGLGNQMFQMATAYAHSRKLNTDCAFDFNGCYTPLQGNTSDKYKNNFFSNFKELIESPKIMNSWAEPSFSYSEIPLTIGNDIILHGFFQSEKYFKEYKLGLLRLFDTFPRETITSVTPFINNIMIETGSNNLVSIHVRRGDYVGKGDFHTNLTDTDYYERAMNMFEDSVFIFVSDDIEWCKENFKGDNIFYSPFTSELDDLYLMVLCNHHIIANSSFSWWGAYLSDNKETVVAPKNWFGPRGPSQTQDLIPDGWKII